MCIALKKGGSRTIFANAHWTEGKHKDIFNNFFFNLKYPFKCLFFTFNDIHESTDDPVYDLRDSESFLLPTFHFLAGVP